MRHPLPFLRLCSCRWRLRCHCLIVLDHIIRRALLSMTDSLACFLWVLAVSTNEDDVDEMVSSNASVLHMYVKSDQCHEYIGGSRLEPHPQVMVELWRLVSRDKWNHCKFGIQPGPTSTVTTPWWPQIWLIYYKISSACLPLPQWCAIQHTTEPVPSPEKRRLASERASGRKRCAPKPPGVKSCDECVRQDLQF